MRSFVLVLGCLMFSSFSLAKDDDISVNDVMTDVITPATNTLWGVEDPDSDAEWQELADAAALVIDAADKIRKGGSGPDDNEWASDPDWQVFLDTLVGAATDAQKAVAERDLDALFDANDILYPPCEECHIQFHPGVSGQDAN